MNQNQNQSTIAPPMSDTDRDEINVMDLVIALAKHKKLIFLVTSMGAVIAAAISFTLPPVFRADTTLMPLPQAHSGVAGVLSQMGGAAGMVAAEPGITIDTYVGMLKSRRVADALIKRFSLLDVYQTSSAEQARLKLAASTTITAGKDGLLKITVEDLDGARAAQMANGYVGELEKQARELSATVAGTRRRQLETTRHQLAVAEASLKTALAAQGVINGASESRAIIETISRLRAQVSAKEIQVGSMKASVAENDVEFKRANEDLGSLRSELNRLENGRSLAGEKADPGPTKAKETTDLLRDMKYYQMLYELLAEQYEMARLSAVDEPSVIRVLDPAVQSAPTRKPSRSLIVVLSTVLAFFAAVFFAFAWEAKQRLLRSPSAMAKWHELKAHW